MRLRSRAHHLSLTAGRLAETGPLGESQTRPSNSGASDCNVATDPERLCHGLCRGHGPGVLHPQPGPHRVQKHTLGEETLDTNQKEVSFMVLSISLWILWVNLASFQGKSKQDQDFSNPGTQPPTEHAGCETHIPREETSGEATEAKQLRGACRPRPIQSLRLSRPCPVPILSHPPAHPVPAP